MKLFELAKYLSFWTQRRIF